MISVEAFRNGRPVTMNDFAPDLFRGMERASAPDFKHRLVQHWIPALPDVERKLRAAGTAVDVGCGSGLASVVLGRAYPNSRFFGYDPHAPSIARARANAKAAGLADRVQFVVADASRLPEGRFDLVTVFNSVHHFSDPVGNFISCRKALAPGGSFFFNESASSGKLEEDMDLFVRLSYPATTLWCLQDSLANNGAGIGSDSSEPLMRELARKSGFTRFRKLEISTKMLGLYELKA